MVGRRSGGLLEEDLLDGWQKIWWMIGRRSGGWFEEGLGDGWKRKGI
jgi:hypothetical protein